MSEKLRDAIELRKVTRFFYQGGRKLQVLHNVSLCVVTGEAVGLKGPSGSGKSTLLHVAGLLEKPDDGEVLIDGRESSNLADDARTQLRRHQLGFVYQFHHLLPEFTALENVMLPQIIARSGKSAAADRARALLDRVGLGARLAHRPGQLSGGEQQRVAVARALANKPKVLLADEPTGNLDPDSGIQILDLLLGFVLEDGLAAIIATHNQRIAERLSRVLVLHDGCLT